MNQTTDKLIVALDVPTFDAMKAIVENVEPLINMFKVGHQLFTAEGPAVLAYLKARKKQVFLDLKLHEIPNSVGLAIESAGKHGVDMVTVHASGGMAMMQTAVSAAAQFPFMKIIALTVVTGLTNQDLADIGMVADCEAQVIRLAKLAKTSGCHGVIASPKEIAPLRQAIGNEWLIITPGVRPATSSQGDQARVGTPEQAIQSGADYLIIGRPIVKADNPRLAVMQIVSQILAT